MTGYLDNLSSKQLATLIQFREHMSNVDRKELKDDRYLLRWLRAREFDIRKSEKMLRTHLEWRKQSRADHIVQEYVMPEVIKRYYPGGFAGHDRLGRPIWIDPVGFSDPKSMARAITPAQLLRSRHYIMEYIHQVLLPQRSTEEGKVIDTICVIYDTQHLGRQHLWRPGLDCFIELVQLAEQNYPETMGDCFVVNAPSVFHIIFNLVKPFLHPQTQKKVHILGKDFRTVLLQHIDPDQIPVRYGGNRTDPDGNPDLRSMISYGGVVSEEWFLCESKDLLEVVVPRGESFSVDIDVNRENVGIVNLCWEFVTVDHDIAFELLYCGSGPTPCAPISSHINLSNSSSDANASDENVSDTKIVIPRHHVNSHVAPERDKLLCSAAGRYTLRFDNSYSWARSKKLRYRATLEPIDKDLSDSQMTKNNG